MTLTLALILTTALSFALVGTRPAICSVRSHKETF